MLADLFKQLDDALSDVKAKKVAVDDASVVYSGAQSAFNDAVQLARSLETQVRAAVAETLGDDRVRQS